MNKRILSNRKRKSAISQNSPTSQTLFYIKRLVKSFSKVNAIQENQLQTPSRSLRKESPEHPELHLQWQSNR